MDFTKMTRDPERLKGTLKDHGGKRYTTTGCSIVFPERYRERGLALISSETQILGYFAIVVDQQYYAVHKAPAMIRTTFDRMQVIKIGDEAYIELIYEPGSAIFDNTTIVKDDSLLYPIYNEMIEKGRMHVAFDYVKDHGMIFDNAGKYAGVNLGATPAVTELIVANIVRDQSDKTILYRHVVKTATDLKKKPFAVVPLNSVTYGASNTVAKFIGANWDEAVNAALVHPSDRVEPIETLLRK